MTYGMALIPYSPGVLTITKPYILTIICITYLLFYLIIEFTVMACLFIFLLLLWMAI